MTWYQLTYISPSTGNRTGATSLLNVESQSPVFWIKHNSIYELIHPADCCSRPVPGGAPAARPGTGQPRPVPGRDSRERDNEPTELRSRGVSLLFLGLKSNETTDIVTCLFYSIERFWRDEWYSLLAFNEVIASLSEQLTVRSSTWLAAQLVRQQIGQIWEPPWDAALALHARQNNGSLWLYFRATPEPIWIEPYMI